MLQSLRKIWSHLNKVPQCLWNSNSETLHLLILVFGDCILINWFFMIQRYSNGCLVKILDFVLLEKYSRKELREWRIYESTCHNSCL